MLRTLLDLSVFTFAFLIGYVVVFDITDFDSHRIPPTNRVEQTPAANSHSADVGMTDKKPDFVPEFRDMQDFDDLEYREPQGKLIDMLGDGVFRQSEVVAKNREPWFVLVKQGGQFSLKDAIASVKKLRTVNWPGDELDAKLKFQVPGKPIIALKDIRFLTPGPVETLFQQGLWDENENPDLPHEELSDGYRREFVMNSESYVLRTSRGLTKNGTKVAVLVLESNGTLQIIKQSYHAPSDDRDIIGSLLWVGDLDRDGKLDIYLDEFNEKGSIGTELHLSTFSNGGELVGLAADFGTAGC